MELQQQIFLTALALDASNFSTVITDRLMELTNGDLDLEGNLEEELTPLRSALAAIHEELKTKRQPPWIKPRAVRRELRILGKMLRPRSLKNMIVELAYVVETSIPLKDIPLAQREINRAFLRVDSALSRVSARRESVKRESIKRSSAKAPRKIASKNSVRKKTRPMAKFA